VEAKEVAAQTIAVKDDTAVLGQGEKDAHLAACEALLLESSLLAQLKSQPPKVIIFPGYFHDACILPLLSGVCFYHHLLIKRNLLNLIFEYIWL